MHAESSPFENGDACARLFQRFADLGISAPTVPYPAHRTVEEGKRLRGIMAGIFIKNLLLKDTKGRLFLLAVNEARVLDLKTLPTLLGAQGRMSFASREIMSERLGVSPGALTPLAIMNDADNVVTVVVDASLLKAEQINMHPLVNTESTALRPNDLIAFIQSCGRQPLLITFD